MKKSVTTFFLIALSAAVLGAGNDGGSARSTPSDQTNTVIETYADGTDVGLWHCSVNVPRILATNGGTPRAYIQQGGFSSHVPTWARVTARVQPGINDTYRIDSVDTADWTSLGAPTK